MFTVSPPAKESQYYTASDLRRVIGQMGFTVSYPRGSSMRPLIWQDQHYVVVSKLEQAPKIGDILVFEHIRGDRTAYIVHRLVGIEDIDGTKVYVMRGDNCIGSERIREEDIIGIVTEIYRNGAWRPWHALPCKHITMRHSAYRLYSSLWTKSWPARKQLYKFRAKLAQIKHRLA